MEFIVTPLPETLVLIFVFVLGAIIGSFLNVVIYRFNTGRSINGHSHCLTCGERLQWYELFPILSYLVQLGKCRHCHAHVPPRYLFVELLTGGVFVFLWHLFSAEPVVLIAQAAIASLLIVVAVYDLRHTIIPDELVLALGTAALLLSGFQAWGSAAVWPLVFDGFGAFCAAGFFYGLWRVSHGRWIGLGDAKLALPLGFLVGAANVFSLVVLAFWIGALISVTLIGVQKILKRGQTHLPFLASPLTIRSEVPFAPFLILSFVLVYYFYADIFAITTHFLTR